MANLKHSWIHGLIEAEGKFYRSVSSAMQAVAASLVAEPRPRRWRSLRLRRISAAPGHWFLYLAEFVCSPREMDNILRPAVQDMRHEYWRALEAGRPTLARFVRARWTWHILMAAGLTKLSAVGKLIARLWKVV